MQRYQFYLLVGVLITSALRRGPSELMAADDRPNIIFVITDDQRWDQLGCTGHPVLKTPHIDRIGREGASFNNFFVATPLCSPSRASFLTGLSPPILGDCYWSLGGAMHKHKRQRANILPPDSVYSEGIAPA